MRLSPLDPEMYRMQAGMAVAHLFAKRFDEASSWAAKSFQDLPNYLMVLVIIAASQATDGRIDGERQDNHHQHELDTAKRELKTVLQGMHVARRVETEGN